VLAVVLVVLVIFGYSLSGKYNTIVQLDEGVKAAWSQVENVYQRRLDLIPNLVATVQGEANFEQETLIQVTEARASATKLDIDVSDAQQMTEFQQMQGGLSQALGRLLVASENYPTLQSNGAFSDLRVQLEGTENRISVERMNYNQAAQTYNVYIRTFPTMFVASLLGFKRAELFSALEGAEVVPVVQFE
jgi:LemA protein